MDIINDITKVEERDGIYFKRDDTFNVFGVCGGKSRSAYQIIERFVKEGKHEFVTAGSRFSPQCEIVSFICQNFGVKCHLFMPNGKRTSVIDNIEQNSLSKIHRTKVGYNSKIIHDAELFAKENNFVYIPFGMECLDNIEATKHQVRNIPESVKRIVVPCGSGMTMISIIKGLEFYGMYDKEVVGVVVGKNPTKTFSKFIHDDLFETTKIDYKFIKSSYDYHQKAKNTLFCGIELDPIYESKCVPFVNKGDMLWIVGKRINGKD